MGLWETIKHAFRAVKGNLLRTVLTFSIIAIGITALVGILTAIDSIEASISSNFSDMGANTFNIRNVDARVRREGGDRKVFPPITYREATTFEEKFTFPSITTVSTRASFAATINRGSRETNPNVTVYGVDGEYLTVRGYSLANGRNFSQQELITGSNVAILGTDIVEKLFASQEDVVGKYVSIGSVKYLVVGVLTSQGSSFVSSDNIVLIPNQNARRYYTSSNSSYIISVMVNDPSKLDLAVYEAAGLFRVIRGLRTGENNDFGIRKSDRLANTLIEQLSYVTIAATIIGFITLTGAAVGLMNIMLVSVNERPREIGLSKAMGATSKIIRRQFLVEAIIICQIGGVLGVVLGILAGNGVSIFLDGSFIIPWIWILSGLLLCLVVGIVAGIYPAIRASRLDPIEALRYE
ncbi:MAG: ABC transporter [Bacteroidetes bacterium SW_11_45_7]|nr:MAG: ABC transporter [Bacteroidetes bacterium SW_11_45_7]